jgi:hypothetical protein
MTMQGRGRSVLGWFTVACALGAQLLAREAHADTKSCVASHASAQREAKAGRLKLASQLYTTCGSDNECPEQLRTECAGSGRSAHPKSGLTAFWKPWRLTLDDTCSNA